MEKMKMKVLVNNLVVLEVESSKDYFDQVVTEYHKPTIDMLENYNVGLKNPLDLTIDSEKTLAIMMYHAEVAAYQWSQLVGDEVVYLHSGNSEIVGGQSISVKKLA